MPTVAEIARTIEEYAPLKLQESYDNAGLQVGDPGMEVSAALLCLDVTEETVKEAERRECNLIISHHPLLFKGLKHLTGSTPTERIVMEALAKNIAIYSAHTNLDSAERGVSYEMAMMLDMKDILPLIPSTESTGCGMGAVGRIEPTPTLEFLRKVKEIFSVRNLKYAGPSSKLVIHTVALCGGSGAEFIPDAIAAGADIFISADIKYHEFTTNSQEIVIADIGHYESEVCTKKIFSHLLHENFPALVTYQAELEKNPVKYL